MCQMQIAEIAWLIVADECDPWLASTKAVVFGQAPLVRAGGI
jgi:hypothetical protein